MENELSCSLLGIEVATPSNKITTEELLFGLRHRMTDELIHSVYQLGVDSRYSVIEDYASFLATKGGERRLKSSTTHMAVDALNKVIESSGIDPSKIGLFIGITSTPNRQLPCFAYEVMSILRNIIPSDANCINLQNQGCSILPKAIDLAKQFLTLNTGKLAIIVVAESVTAYSDPFTKEMYYGFHELGEREHGKTEFMETLRLIESCLFGDGAAAMVLGATTPGMTTFKTTKHITNIEEGDLDLIYIDEGGMNRPSYDGCPQYVMSQLVPFRGAQYVQKLTENLVQDTNNSIVSLSHVSLFLIHTGSLKILTGVCKRLKVENALEKSQHSMDVLKNYGNLSAVSIGFIMDSIVKEQLKGTSIMLSFGAGFSASLGVVEFN